MTTKRCSGSQAFLPGAQHRRLDRLAVVAGVGQRRGGVDEHDRRASGAAHAGRVESDVLVGQPAEPHVDAERGIVADGVEVPALVPQRLRAGLVPALVSRVGAKRGQPPAARLRQQLDGVEIERLLRIPRKPRHEHLIAALGAHHDHRGRDRHQQAVEAQPPVLLPAVLERQSPGPVRAERLVVDPEQLALGGPPRLDIQAAADEVGGVEHRRAPAHRLPVDHHGVVAVEQQIVEAVVAMDETERRPPVRGPAVEARDEPAAQLGVLVGDALAVALQERGQQLHQQAPGPAGSAG